MSEDPVVEEIRRVGQAYARQFDFNVRAIVDDLRKKEQEHPDRLVRYEPKPVRHFKTA